MFSSKQPRRERECVDKRSKRCSQGASSVCSRADDAVCEHEHNELGPRFELQLAHDVRAMRVDRAYGDVELPRDLLIRTCAGFGTLVAGKVAVTRVPVTVAYAAGS